MLSEAALKYQVVFMARPETVRVESCELKVEEEKIAPVKFEAVEASRR